MRSPKVPPMLALLVTEALSVLNGAVFDSLGRCPQCGGPVSGYDMRQRRFARLTGIEGVQTITVLVKRFRCLSCGTICNADEPFYPATRIGAPVIDLCIVFSQAFGYGRGARNLSVMGMEIDRMRCRHYAQIPVGPVPSLNMYGFPVPQSILSLSGLVTNFAEGGRVKGAEALAACGFPSAHRAALHPPPPRKERDERDEQERDEERDVKEPEYGTHQKRPGEQGNRDTP
ncbi:MAG: hypothetical protein A4E35_00718 [Methanoregula sp. PtaU1.Bin051]|nr:MAG: hypothetical protein A4E35_00718 [Methanoregula sp. PtaU1.Bin051]